MIFSPKYALIPQQRGHLMRRFHALIEYTQTHVKTSFKLVNLKIKSLIKDYTGEWGSNQQKNKENF